MFGPDGLFSSRALHTNKDFSGEIRVENQRNGQSLDVTALSSETPTLFYLLPHEHLPFLSELVCADFLAITPITTKYWCFPLRDHWHDQKQGKMLVMETRLQII